MLYILKALPDLVYLVVLVTNAYRAISKELGQAASRKEIENAIKSAKTGNTTDIENIINRKL